MKGMATTAKQSSLGIVANETACLEPASNADLSAEVEPLPPSQEELGIAEVAVSESAADAAADAQTEIEDEVRAPAVVAAPVAEAAAGTLVHVARQEVDAAAGALDDDSPTPVPPDSGIPGDSSTLGVPAGSAAQEQESTKVEEPTAGAATASADTASADDKETIDGGASLTTAVEAEAGPQRQLPPKEGLSIEFLSKHGQLLNTLQQPPGSVFLWASTVYMTFKKPRSGTPAKKVLCTAMGGSIKACNKDLPGAIPNEVDQKSIICWEGEFRPLGECFNPSSKEVYGKITQGNKVLPKLLEGGHPFEAWWAPPASHLSACLLLQALDGVKYVFFMRVKDRAFMPTGMVFLLEKAAKSEKGYVH